MFQTKAGFKKGGLVQKEVVEVHNGQETRYAKRFFIHERMHEKECDRWLYQLDEEEDGKAGQPYNEHKWYKERDLSFVT